MIRCKFKELLLEKEYREERRIFRKEMVQMTGLSSPYIYKVANHIVPPDSIFIARMCEYFGCKEEDLVTEVPDRPIVRSTVLMEMAPRCYMAELIADKEFQEERIITMHEICETTKLPRRDVSQLFYNQMVPLASHIKIFCEYFNYTSNKFFAYVERNSIIEIPVHPEIKLFDEPKKTISKKLPAADPAKLKKPDFESKISHPQPGVTVHKCN